MLFLVMLALNENFELTHRLRGVVGACGFSYFVVDIQIRFRGTVLFRRRPLETTKMMLDSLYCV